MQPIAAAKHSGSSPQPDVIILPQHLTDHAFYIMMEHMVYLQRQEAIVSAFLQVNWLAVLVCAVLSMVVGFIWYGPLFAKLWGELTGWTNEKVAELPQSSLMANYGLAFLCAVLIAFVLANLVRIASPASWIEGAGLGGLLWLGFTGPTIGVNMVFERRDTRLFLIEAGYHFVTMTLYAVILTLWR